MNFFQTLPDLTSPVPTVSGGTDMIGLIPLFDDPYFDNFQEYLKAAIYSRQTWLLHTDASDQNVAIKLYIEDTLKAEALPILEANGLTEADVLWFNAPPLPDTRLGVWGRLGKKLCLYWDPQLQAYAKIAYWDADMFKLPNPQTDFFAHAKTLEYFTFLRTFTFRRRDWRPRMIRKTVKNTRFGGIPVQDIFTRAELGRVLQAVKGHLTRPAAGLCVYPASTFRVKHQPFLEFLQTHGPYIGDDEWTIAVAAERSVLFLDNFRRVMGLTHVNVFGYLNGDTDHACLHGKAIPTHTPHYRETLIRIGSSEMPISTLDDSPSE